MLELEQRERGCMGSEREEREKKMWESREERVKCGS